MDGVQNSEKETPQFPTLYHQTTPENAERILKEGFKRGLKGAGSNGPLRGIFIKTIPDMLTGAGIGQSQIEVSINPKVKLLDLSKQGSSDAVDAPERLNYQHFALTHWLSRNGHPELAEDYQYAIGDLMHYRKSEPLDSLWPKIEKLLKDKGFGGIIYKEFHIEGEKEGEEFLSIVVFSPEDLIVKK